MMAFCEDEYTYYGPAANCTAYGEPCASGSVDRRECANPMSMSAAKLLARRRCAANASERVRAVDIFTEGDMTLGNDCCWWTRCYYAYCWAAGEPPAGTGGWDGLDGWECNNYVDRRSGWLKVPGTCT